MDKATLPNDNLVREIWGFSSIHVFNSDLLGCNTVLRGYIIPTFRRNVLSSTRCFFCNTVVTRLSVAYINMVEDEWHDICTEYWWNETSGENRSTQRITNPSDTFSTTFLTWTDRDESQSSVVKARRLISLGMLRDSRPQQENSRELRSSGLSSVHDV